MKNLTKNPFERKQKGAVLMLLFAVFFIALGCGNSKISDIKNSDSTFCENKEILKILIDEPAIVRKGCFEHLGNVDAFFFELENSQYEFVYQEAVFPLKEIPKQYRKEGSTVYISGNVMNCFITTLGCLDTQYYRLAPRSLGLFELKSIKINN